MYGVAVDTYCEQYSYNYVFNNCGYFVCNNDIQNTIMYSKHNLYLLFKAQFV